LDIALKLLYAFLIGGGLCVTAQILIDKTALTPARILVFYVTLGVFLSAVGIYPVLVKLAGEGAAVPLTGFGHVIAEGVRRAVDEKGALGILTGGMTAASGGITAAIVFGYITALVSKGKPK